MRFGLQLHADDPTQVGADARRAEDLGFDTVLVADHVGSDWSPWQCLAAAVAATERIHVGTFVLNASLHHPLMVAREVATLDRLSGGRVELGLGAGHTPAEFAAMGTPLLPGRRAQGAPGRLRRDHPCPARRRDRRPSRRPLRPHGCVDRCGAPRRAGADPRRRERHRAADPRRPPRRHRRLHRARPHAARRPPPHRALPARGARRRGRRSSGQQPASEPSSSTSSSRSST